MAFTLFKKKAAADAVFKNGNIRTYDPEYPIASCMAVKDGKILAVGDESLCDDFEGKETVSTDLGGKWVIPGFIDLYGNPSKDVFSGTFIPLTENMSKEEITAAIVEHAAFAGESDVLFGYGFSSSLFEKAEEDEMKSFKEALDEAAGDIPVVLLSKDNLSMILSGSAAKIAQDAADEENLPYLSQSFVMSTLISTDFSACAPALAKVFTDYAKRGYTSVLNLEKAGYFESLYRDMCMNAYQAGALMQRQFGSYSVQRALRPETVLVEMNRRFTYCRELAPLVNSNRLIIYADSDEESPGFISQKLIELYADICAEKGYNIDFVPAGKDAMLKASKAAGDLSVKYKKSVFCVRSAETLSDEEKATLISGEEFYITPDGALSNLDISEGKTYGEAACLALTQKAAQLLGCEARLGVLEEGFLADFAVYDNDPFAAQNESDFKALSPSAVYLNGELVFSCGAGSEEDCAAKLTTFFDEQALEFAALREEDGSEEDCEEECV